MTNARGGRLFAWLNSLRTRLFAAIAALVVLSVGVTLLIGSVLTRREVERATLRDVSHQADLLAGRERLALLPFARLKTMEPFLKRQGQRVVAVRLDRPSVWLTDEERAALRAGRGVEGTVMPDSVEFYFAARPVSGRAFVLLRPKQVGATSAEPYLKGLALAAGLGAALAAIASLLLARAISRPVRRVAEASGRLVTDESPELVPVEGPTELAMLAESFNDMASQLAYARAAERSFLLSVSHELRTPLTAIRGYAEGLAEGAVSADEATEVIRVEALRLERLIRDVIDLARMQRTDFSIESEEVDLADAAREAVRRYEPQARSFGVSLEAVANGAAPALGDPDRVLQVVSNLVENALRVTPAGGSVRVSAEPGEVVVEDNGPGLDAEELPHAFERFFLWKRYGDTRAVGTGLGLAIVKELTEGMSGRVDVESRPQRGTRFVVRLPAAAAREPDRQPAAV